MKDNEHLTCNRQYGVEADISYMRLKRARCRCFKYPEDLLAINFLELRHIILSNKGSQPSNVFPYQTALGKNIPLFLHPSIGINDYSVLDYSLIYFDSNSRFHLFSVSHFRLIFHLEI